MTSVSNVQFLVRNADTDPSGYVVKRGKVEVPLDTSAYGSSSDDSASPFAGYMSSSADSSSLILPVDEPGSPISLVSSIPTSPVPSSDLDDPPTTSSDESLDSQVVATTPNSSTPSEVASISVREQLLRSVMSYFISFEFSTLPDVKQLLQINEGILSASDNADVYFSFGKALILAYTKKENFLVISDIVDCLKKGIDFGKQTTDQSKIDRMVLLATQFRELLRQRLASSPFSLSDALRPPSQTRPVSSDHVFPNLHYLNNFVKSKTNALSQSLIATLYLNYGYAQLELYKQKRDRFIAADLLESHQMAMKCIRLEDTHLQIRAHNLLGIFMENRNAPGDLMEAVSAYQKILKLNKGQNLLGTALTLQFQLAIQRVLGLMGYKAVIGLPPCK